MYNPSRQLTLAEEWTEFFGQQINLGRIEKSCLSGRLRGSHVRSIIWRILLKCLPLERNEWLAILSRTRNSYARSKSQLLTNPHEQASGLDPNVSNPLSLGSENPWQLYFADCELRECINRDVERTFPELQYFKDEKVRRTMSDILFVYAKQHPEIAYRQGMHEILAPLIFVLYYDQQAFAHSEEQGGFENLLPEELKILRAVNDQSFLEHDSFDIFTQLMMMLERWYLAGDEGYVVNSVDASGSNGKFISAVPFSGAEEADPMSELIVKLRCIMNDVLAVVDPVLHMHFVKLQIIPQIYGIRWLRLLFGREFPIHDLLFVWDAIFAFRPPLSLVDYVFVAMLEQIRHLMIGEDYSTTLQYLMRYPPVADVHSLIQYALHIKSPKKFERPRTPNIANFENITVAGMIHPNRGRHCDPKNVLDKQAGSVEQMSPRRTVHNVDGNRQQEDTKSFVAKIVDSLSDRNAIERGPTRSLIYGKDHLSATPSNMTIRLLQEQVSCLQSRLNDMDMMAGVVRQRIDIVISEQLPNIVGNDVLKELITTELRSVLSQIENATRPGGNHSQVENHSCHASVSLPNDVEVGDEVCVPASHHQQRQSRTGSPLAPRRRTSRMETEMREIRPRSLAR